MTTLPTDEIMVEGGSGKTKTSLPMTVSSDTSSPVHHTPTQSQNRYITRSGREITPPPPQKVHILGCSHAQHNSERSIRIVQQTMVFVLKMCRAAQTPRPQQMQYAH